VGINWNQRAKECEEKLKKDISSYSSSELIECMETFAILNSGNEPDFLKRANKIQAIDSILSIRAFKDIQKTIHNNTEILNKIDTTIKLMEKTIKTLNRKNSFLTILIIFLAIATVAIQILK
jgi:hypothetical protein